MSDRAAREALRHAMHPSTYNEFLRVYIVCTSCVTTCTYIYTPHARYASSNLAFDQFCSILNWTERDLT
jgi:hypothetical protein